MFKESQFEKTLPLGIQIKARGAQSNQAGRFERFARETFLDGWDAELETKVLQTRTVDERTTKIITKNKSPDISFDRSINPYRGCEHGCVYCYARPTHSYLGLSAGLDFETKLTRKKDAAEILEKELSSSQYQPKVIAIGTNTDPYQPIEGRDEIMRDILKVLSDWNHPVMITTRGTLIERDIDLLAPMAAKGLVHVGISMTTLGSRLSRQLEPRAPAPVRRLKIMSTLSAQGIPVRAMIAPVIPALTDHELEAIVSACANHGARAATYLVLRLPGEVSELFETWLHENVPDRAKRILKRLEELHGGKIYDPRFGHRFKGQGEWAKLLKARFELSLRHAKMSKTLPDLRCDLFERPQRIGDQLALF